MTLAWLFWAISWLGIAGALSAALTITVRFRDRAASSSPGSPDPPPAVSIVVPMRGADPRLDENLTRLVRSDVGVPVEYLFAVETAEDPAYEVAERVRRAHPAADVRVVRSGAAEGRMGKQHNIAAAARVARHEALGSMDADVRVDPGTLAAGLRRLAAPGAGVAYFLPHYRGPGPGPAGGRLVALYSNYYYQLYLGAMALSGNAAFITGGLWLMSPAARRELGDLGRFTTTVSDDAAIGRAVREAGLSNELVPATVGMAYEELSLRDGARHVLKWLTLLRAEGLAAYLAIAVLWHPLPWAVLAAATALLAGAGAPELAVAGATVAGALLSRAAGTAALHARAYGRRSTALSAWLPVYELVAAPVLFARGLFARELTWRGRRYRIGRRGEIRAVTPVSLDEGG